ncbi:GvpL/GvpF family gas vesicle protein [Aciduricibacillus chroicocephali]|uniref:GvpL/GvpF family gas vesicle protein n=1 Tax=Aciduricibacillus chroicocephali TaxID=3054939 RepID=A0ABY9KY57_9BACI|nr:GvpL/GvpF family gas vesicle protein [Bacillaceae bacterium 44XB]
MNDLIYLYGLVPKSEMETGSVSDMADFSGDGHLRAFPIGDAAAIVCTLDGNEYSEEVIKERTSNDMEWLQEKAFHHHETVLELARRFTVIPLKFCTLYKSEDSLVSSIEPASDKLRAAFEKIAGNEEWNLKIYCNDTALKQQFSTSNPALEEKKAAISTLPKGRQFFENKKIDKWLDGEIEKEKDKMGETIHEQLSNLALTSHVKKTWSKDATGRPDPMTWNSVYLVSKREVESFLQKIEDCQKDLEAAGWQLEATGPWPAYHFSSIS